MTQAFIERRNRTRVPQGDLKVGSVIYREVVPACQGDNDALIVRLVERDSQLTEVCQSCRRISGTQPPAPFVYHQGVPQFVPPDTRHDRPGLDYPMHGLFGKRFRLVLKAP